LKRIHTRGFFVERRWAEKDSSFKQIIPYTVVCSGEAVLLLRRLAAGGEPRLHGKLSIGVGGHINPVDRDVDAFAAETEGKKFIDRAALRELEEEVALQQRPRIEAVGLVNDESNPVGSVHLGLVYLARVDRPEARVRETTQLEGHFVSIDELQHIATQPQSKMETWSALLCKRLKEVLAAGATGKKA
jgi:predicted NUDIX family phosphoesterase